MERFRKRWRVFKEEAMLCCGIHTKEEIRERDQAQVELVVRYLNRCVAIVDYLIEGAECLLVNHSRMSELKFKLTTYIQFISNKWLLCPLNIPMDYYLNTGYIWKGNIRYLSTSFAISELLENFEKATELSDFFWKKTSLKKKVKQMLCCHFCCI